MEAGYHNIQWDGTTDSGDKIASGIYIYRIQAGNFVQTKKMLLIK
jgi:flagellar hook assembly protein FlgD